jgi:hydroxypyruvate reductase
VNLHKLAKQIFEHSILSINPYSIIKSRIGLNNLEKFKDIYIIGAGKATASMAKAIEEILNDRITEGIINVKYRHTQPLKKIKINQAGHPIPDEAGKKGALEIINLAKKAKKDDLVICLLSGGASALLPVPVDRVTLKEKQLTTDILLKCGAKINEVNIIRKHISQIKGGRLAQIVAPARLITLILSDVVGDDLSTIASGPTVPDETTFDEALKVIKNYDLIEKIPNSVIEYIKSGIQGKVEETPKKDNPIFKNVENIIIGNNFDALQAGKIKAEELGFNTLILSSQIEGETKQVAKVHTAIAKEIIKTNNPIKKPACIISGGETTVTIKGDGLGGRNQEFVLSSAIEIDGLEDIVILSAGTDGTDGPTDAAGAIADGNTIKRAKELGMNAEEFLERNDSYHFFKKLGNLLITGPTNTNVMDLRIILIG